MGIKSSWIFLWFLLLGLMCAEVDYVLKTTVKPLGTKQSPWDYLYKKAEIPQPKPEATPPLPPPILRPGAPWYVLTYLAVYYGLHRFSPFLGYYRIWGYIVNLLMVGIPVGSSLVGFHPSSLFHHLGSFLPQEWIPDKT